VAGSSWTRRAASWPRAPNWTAPLDVAREGDEFVITRLGRLGNSLLNLLELTELLRTRGIDLIVLEQGIDTTTPAGKLAFHVLASVMQFQRELIVANTYDGLAAARAVGAPASNSRSSLLARQRSRGRCTTRASTRWPRSPPSSGCRGRRSTGT
jgi:DNA invertase Pin-like site-specific DNA recombinase